MDNVRFAQTIKNARLKKGYTQSQLADLLNVSNKTISKWETGRGYPDITLLAKITSILKLDYEELLQSNEYIIQKRKKKRKYISIIFKAMNILFKKERKKENIFLSSVFFVCLLFFV